MTTHIKDLGDGFGIEYRENHGRGPDNSPQTKLMVRLTFPEPWAPMDFHVGPKMAHELVLILERYLARQKGFKIALGGDP